MLAAALRDGSANRPTTFEVFARRLPTGRRYGVVAGTGRLLEALPQFRFDADACELLAQFLDPATVRYLREFRFRGDIDGYAEGELYFPGSPVLSVRGSFAECVLLETLVLSIFNHDTAIASAAARMVSAAGGRPLDRRATPAHPRQRVDRNRSRDGDLGGCHNRSGAQHVLRMPEQEGELVRELAEAAESARDDGICGAVVAVIGGRGGAGASLFAVALAQAAADALLVDLDPWAGGIDLLVGGETAPGLRWPDLALQGGRLNWSAVRAALPRPRGISVLSGTRRGYELDAGPVDAVIDAGRRGGVTVVCDLPRRLTDATQAALDAADLVVLVSPCDVRACAAAATMAPVLTAINPNLGLVVRGPSPGGLRAAEVADVAGVPLLASMRAQPRLAEQLEHGGLRLRRRSVLASAARRVLGVLPRAGSGRHGRAA